MIAFEVAPGTNPEAVRRALVACRAPVRVEREGMRARIMTSTEDADAARGLWLRAGLEPSATAEWPPLEQVSAGVIAAAGRWWCIGRAPLGAAGLPRAMLLLVPVSADEAIRALVAALRRPPWQLRRRREPRALARTGVAVARRGDGIARCRAYLLADAASPREALAAFDAARRSCRAPIWRLRAGAARAWEEIAWPTSGIWRRLSALEGWWT